MVWLVKNQPATAEDARDTGSIPGLGRSSRVGSGYPFQYSCLENSMDRGGWRATVDGITKSQTRLSTHTHTHTHTDTHTHRHTDTHTDTQTHTHTHTHTHTRKPAERTGKASEEGGSLQAHRILETEGRCLEEEGVIHCVKFR